MRTSLLAIASAGAKQTTRAPPSRDALRSPQSLGMPPASTTWPTRRREADVDQLHQLRVHRDQVDAERLRRSARRWRRSRRRAARGDIEPEAMTPNPPAFEIAATRLRSDTQVIAPPMIASSVPRKSRPRAHSRSSSARRRRRLRTRRRACRRVRLPDRRAAELDRSSGAVEPVGGMQRPQRQLGVFGGDQHADLDLRGRDHLDVDALARPASGTSAWRRRHGCACRRR